MVKQLTHLVKKAIYGQIFQNILVIIYAKCLAEIKKRMYNVIKLIIYCHEMRMKSMNPAHFSIERGI